MKSINHGEGPISPLAIHLADNLFETNFSSDIHFLLGIKLFDAGSNTLVLLDMVVITDSMVAVGLVEQSNVTQAVVLERAKSVVQQAIADHFQAEDRLPVYSFLTGLNKSHDGQHVAYFSNHAEIAQWLESQISSNSSGSRNVAQGIVETILDTEKQSRFLHNHAQVGKALQILQTGLTPFVEQEMKAFFGEEWRQQLSGHSSRKHTLDIPLLLKTMLQHWQTIFEKKIGKTQRSLIYELLSIRNQWAHPQPEMFSLDDTYRALDTAGRLLKAVSVTDAGTIDQMKNWIMRQQFLQEMAPLTSENNFSITEAGILTSNTNANDESLRETNPASLHDPIEVTQAENLKILAKLKQFLKNDNTYILPSDITSKILIEMERNSREAPHYNRYVPNQYTVQISLANYEHNFQPILKEISDQWREEIVEHLELMNQRAGYRKYNFPQQGNLVVQIEPMSSFKAKQAVVISSFVETDSISNSAETTSSPYLELVYPQYIERRWYLSQNEVTVIGRASDCHVHLDMPDVLRMSKISGHHAYIIYSRDGYKLFDGEYNGGGISAKPSTNGTYVGDQKVLATALEARRIHQYGRPLQDGDKIVLAPPTGRYTEQYTPGMAVLVFRENS